MSDIIKSCPFCGNSDIMVSKKLCLCKICGARADRNLWNTRFGWTTNMEIRKLQRMIIFSWAKMLYNVQTRYEIEPRVPQRTVSKAKKTYQEKADMIMQADDNQLEREMTHIMDFIKHNHHAITGKELTIDGEEVKK